MKLLGFTPQHALLAMALCIVLGATSSIAQQPPSAPDVKDLLPKDATDVDVMQITLPPRGEELYKKLQQGAAEDPDWWLAHVKKAKPGDPLPYDPRMGLTKEEYEEFLTLAKKVTLSKIKTVKVRVKHDGTRIVLDFGDDLRGLKVAELDLKNDTVTTPFGVTTNHLADTGTSLFHFEGQR